MKMITAKLAKQLKELEDDVTEAIRVEPKNRQWELGILYRIAKLKLRSLEG